MLLKSFTRPNINTNTTIYINNQPTKHRSYSTTSSNESEVRTHTRSTHIEETNESELKTDSVEEEETDSEGVESEYESDENEEFICKNCKKLFETWEELTEHNEIMFALCFMEGRLCLELSECKTCYL